MKELTNEFSQIGKDDSQLTAESLMKELDNAFSGLGEKKLTQQEKKLR